MGVLRRRVKRFTQGSYQQEDANHGYKNTIFRRKRYFDMRHIPRLANLPRTEGGVLPVLWYAANGSGGFQSEYGPALSEFGAGTSPSDAGDYHPLTGSGDHATKLPASNGVETAATGTFIGSNNHIRVSLIVSPGLTSGTYIAGSAPPVAPRRRWYIYKQAGGIQFYMQDGTSTVSITVSLADRNWGFVEFFVDRTQSTAAKSLTAFVNGAQSGTPVNASVLSGAVDGDYKFSIGAYPDSIYGSDSDLAMVSVHASNDLGFPGATNDTYWLARHKENFALLTGAYPHALGTAVPTAMTRASAKHLWKADSSGNVVMVQVGAGWPDMCRVYDPTYKRLHVGYRGENAATNLDLDSGADSGWGFLAASNVSAGVIGVLGRDIRLITADGTTTFHTISDTSASCADATQYCLWVIIKKGTERYFWLGADFNGNQRVMWDLDNPSTPGVATSGSPEAHGLFDLGGGNYLGYVRDTTVGAGARAISIGLSNDGNESNSSSGTLYVQHVQLEAGPYPTSPIYTSGGSASRAADVPLWSSTSNVDPNAVDVRFDVVPIIGAVDNDTYRYFFEIENGAAARVSCIFNNTAESLLWYGNNGTVQFQIAGSTSVADGDVHQVKCIAKPNDARLYVDSALDGTPDTALTLPTPANIRLKQYLGGSGWSPWQLISNFRIYKAV